MSIWAEHVLPHGPLTALSPRLWHVTGSLKQGPMPRTMTVWRMADGGLWLHSVVAMDDAGMAALAELGEPRIMVVPNGLHRMDCGAYKDRFPDLKVYAPAGARVRVEKVVPCDGTVEENAASWGVRVLAPDGLKRSEYIYELDCGGVDAGPTIRAWVVGDQLFHLDDLPGVTGWILKWIGSSGFFGISGIGRMLLLTDRRAFSSWLRLQALHAPDILIPAHGKVVTENASAKLSEAADRL